MSSQLRLEEEEEEEEEEDGRIDRARSTRHNDPPSIDLSIDHFRQTDSERSPLYYLCSEQTSF